MSNHVVLNNVDHKDLRILATRSAALGDQVMFALTFAAEFRNIQAHYPIVFRKDIETGEFQPIAMFGFEEHENLFLDDGGWTVPYVPLAIERQPFLIGQAQASTDGDEQQVVVHIDMDSPRVSRTEGEAVFMTHGGGSEFLDRTTSVLRTLHEGLAVNQVFVQALLTLELLESFTLDVELSSGAQHRLVGFYGINEDKLAALDADVLARLHEKGYLQAIYMVIASMSNWRDLIKRRDTHQTLSQD
jgi:hypothetical protein